MGIKKRTTLPRKPLIYSDQGVLVVKTPAVCTRWPTDFRIKLVADYPKPLLMCSRIDYDQRFGKSDKTIHKVSGHRLQVLHPIEDLPSAGRVVILRTEVHNVDTKKTAIIAHDNPAMRILMTYHFLTGENIAGLAPYETY